MREAFLAALRGGIEAIALRRPFVIAFEDIHWADDGMLDAIEHLAQWVRAPLMLVCLARDELLDRRPSWGGGRRSATQLMLSPLSDEHSRALVRALLPAGHEVVPAVAERSGGNPLFAEEMARRITEEGTIEAAELPDTVQAVLAARLDSLEPFERQLVQQASVVGRTFPEGALSTVARAEGRDLGRALVSLQEKDILGPAGDGPLLGERELAFKHVLIRDVAYGHASRRPSAHGSTSRWEPSSRSAPATAPTRWWRSWRSTTAAPRRSGARAASRPRSSTPCAAARSASSRRQATRRPFSTRIARRPRTTGTRARSRRRTSARTSCGSGRSWATYRSGSGAWTRLSASGPTASSGTAARRTSSGWPTFTARSASALSHKGERKAAIEHYQKGINLLKDGPPRIELVRLYEEAAWLYLHTGDNMLAIYASEKALRLAERLDETRAASRAHGIFGRVFGRIGDTEKARQNLERAVELARGSDDGETILALSALGRQLEISEADMGGARAVYEEALALAEQVGMLPAQVELHAWLAQLAAYGADWEQVERSTEASAALAEREGLVGKLSMPYALRGLLRWREGRIGEATVLFHRAHELAEQVGWSEIAFQALFGLSIALRDQSDLDGATAALDQAIEVCERAGLIAQSIQATGARAVILSLAQRPAAAKEAAAMATQMSERLHYPVGRAAAMEARGAVEDDPAAGAELLAEAEEAWRALDRPMEATRARLLAGQILLGTDDERAAKLLAEAAEQSEALGVPHLADKARAAMRAGPLRQR